MKIKNIFITICVACGVALIATSCSDKNDVVANTIDVESANTSFPVEGGTNNITLTNVPSKVYAQDNWLNVSTEGRNVVLTTNLNTSVQSRSTLLIIKKNDNDSIKLNVIQEGIYFGLPQDQRILEDDRAIERSMRVVSNVKMNYGSTADWIKVTYENNILTVRVDQNTTGKPRIGWITSSLDREDLAKRHNGDIPYVRTDSLRVVQASIDDVVGTYTQQAKTMNDKQELVDITSNVQIVKINATSANFIIDNTFTWTINFVKGVGFNMFNGRVARTSRAANNATWYSISVIAADDYANGRATAINGVSDILPLTINKDGNLIFEDALNLNGERAFKSYGFNFYSTRVPDQGSFQGVDKVFIQPSLTRQ